MASEIVFEDVAQWSLCVIWPLRWSDIAGLASTSEPTGTEPVTDMPSATGCLST